MFTRYCRSVLCTPATASDRYANCHRSGADICLVDLEDSVPAPAKADARVRATAFFTGESSAGRRCAVRVNAITEPDGVRDLLALREYPVKPAIVLVPKVESPRDIEIVARLLRPVRPDLELFAVIETPRGVENVAAIAATSPRPRALIFGSADYASALGIQLRWEPLVYARTRVVNAARAAEVEAIDSPTFHLQDLTTLRREAILAQDLGFSGKIALHPRQVAIINKAFSPDAESLEAARRVVAAAQHSSQGITTVEGVMVGRPFFEASQRLLDEFDPPG
ncbi:citrate lyase subunit beta/citryl-CoA lyase/(S)-citramalyl-CoA lyase [Micromonospora sp. Llam0]|uniref:HpcH/HpaI aldolase/citrate lyase family protein n=1 Tax=Micromonospora sp. Llam0 TaxID=2485143 RepID=UPI000F489EBF|nr:CoA ester lyase [Micromonospora sp. Llam0]ROO63152.1 citrate lyase subunit beta/citryl-CoA lyase/(S)-citramalyl-CoA lyase [Micromonospora sp. Llam0]